MAKFSQAGTKLAETSGHANGNPYGLAVDPHGNVYVLNNGENV
ncbi:MAG TPA: SBBP repeat-containing protein [Solirubrobacteraceae bacterium]